MNAEIFIVSFWRDFPYLEFALKSIGKFVSGFAGVTVLVPDTDLQGLLAIPKPMELLPMFRARAFAEWPGKGMLHHERQIVYADQWCPEAEFITHMDSDTIFTAPVTLETFIKDGKPILQYERFDSIGKRHGGVMEWQRVTERCLPFPIEFETMRQHGATYHRGLYARTRELMTDKTGMAVDEYIKSQGNAFPQGFCEFVTLGNVAIFEFPDRYHLADCSKKPNPDKGDFPIAQFWSHAPIDQPQPIWWDGDQKTVTPLDEIRRLGL